MTKVIGIRLNEYQLSKLREIAGREVVTDLVRSLIDKEIDRYNRKKNE